MPQNNITLYLMFISKKPKLFSKKIQVHKWWFSPLTVQDPYEIWPFKHPQQTCFIKQMTKDLRYSKCTVTLSVGLNLYYLANNAKQGNIRHGKVVN